MRNKYGSQILSVLLGWYEDSPAYARGEAPSRRRIMRLYDGGATDFPAYDIKSHMARTDINQAVRELADMGIVGYEWMRGQQDHILSKVWLLNDSIDKAYGYIGRQPKSYEIDELLARLNALYASVGAGAEWARLWLEDIIAAITRKRSVGASLPVDANDCDDLLSAVAYLSSDARIPSHARLPSHACLPSDSPSGGGASPVPGGAVAPVSEIQERAFSLRCFGESKRFERSVKARLVRILKKYALRADCTDEEALRYVGIVRYPEQFMFCGALSIELPRGATDFSPLPMGGSLTIDDVTQGRIIIGQNVRSALSIENYANYIDYIQKSQNRDELVLYHGGQLSPAKLFFFSQVAGALREGCVFRHWGDIDYGGFSMLARLRREIDPRVRPWKMDSDTLAQYMNYTAPFSSEYGKLLEALLNAPELEDCRPCIGFMLNTGVRLEQEALLL